MDEKDLKGVDLSRRDLLKRGAAIAGAVWVVPSVQVLNMSAAAAEGLHHGAPKPSGVVSGPSKPSMPSPPSKP